MSSRKVFTIIFSLIALLLQACGPLVQSGVETGIASTRQISALETAAAGGVNATTTQETANGGSSSVPYVSVSTNTNCRSGPRADYTLLTTINVGQRVEVLKTFSNEYVLVKNPNANGDCWLFLRYANTTDFTAFNLPSATQPPTPTPTPSNTPAPVFDWSGTWHVQFTALTGSMVFVVNGNAITGTFTGSPGPIYVFTGTISNSLQEASGGRNLNSNDTFTAWAAQLNYSNTDQFRGNVDGGLFCGWRSGSSSPNPCLWP